MLNDHLPDDDIRVAGWTDGEASLDIGANTLTLARQSTEYHFICFVFLPLRKMKMCCWQGKHPMKINTSHFEQSAAMMELFLEKSDSSMRLTRSSINRSFQSGR
jgi:hypothetical protein